MKYFIDTEFIEGKQDKTFLGFKYGETKPTIDLISIGIVKELIPIDETDKQRFVDNYMKRQWDSDSKSEKYPKLQYDRIHKDLQKQYYAISKDFNLKAAWNNEWVRENVLKKLFNELRDKYIDECDFGVWRRMLWQYFSENGYPKEFNLQNLKYLIDKYGKTTQQIAKEIIEFTQQKAHNVEIGYKSDGIEFYAYYADYDWVVFCQLFGTMMDLPKGFPMYCKDLKQHLDDSQQERDWELTKDNKYPKQTNEHNALADAKWNYELYKFLKTI